jgi:hypothetical protein
MNKEKHTGFTRREFVGITGAAFAAMGVAGFAGRAGAADAPRDAQGNVIPGFEGNEEAVAASDKGWTPVSDRKIRVGIAGYGLCRFGADFSFQTHPNVEVVAVTDLDPVRCAGLAAACNCEKTYPSCEEMIKDDSIEAVYIATDAPSHARLAIMALEHGKHVASAVPAVFGANALEEAEELYKAVKASGRNYMMYETSCYHRACYAWRQQYEAGLFGKLIYSEGEYYHARAAQLRGYNPRTGKVDGNGWRKGLVPMWYPTHATGYYVGVSNGRLTEVSCLGMPSIYPNLQPDTNDYGNPFGTEVALLRTSEGGIARMAVSWDMPDAHGEQGRVYGQKEVNSRAAQKKPSSVETAKPALPPGVEPGGHGGSHGHLTTEFIDSILLNRKPLVDVGQSLNMTLAGVMAHKSALKDGEWLKIPQYEL